MLSTGRFGGVREPTRREEDFGSITHQTDLTRRLTAPGGEHKIRVGLEATLARAEDVNRGIAFADRNTLLPADVRSFDPYHPNYLRPGYSPAVCRRVITDQQSRLDYAALVADTRTAINHGRTVFTTGLRHDFSGIAVTDRRASAPPATARAERQNGALSLHLGVNQRVGRRVLLFANTSSAIEPSSRVDARTGEIQDHQSTAGVELGARTILLERRLSLSGFVYAYTNSDIARRNPLFNDPVADAAQTQPRLVTSGEEEFRGLSVQLG